MHESMIEYDSDTVYPVLMPRYSERLIILLGDDTVTEFTDHTPTLTDHWTPVQRAVWVARLRAVAQQIEEGESRG